MTNKAADMTQLGRIRMGRPGTTGGDRGRFGLTGVAQPFDARVVAIRPDLADIAVAGSHFAPHYAAPMTRSCVLPLSPLRHSPSTDAEQTSELLFGEGFALLDLTGGWAWGYSLADHYVGYLAAEALGAPIAPTHRVRSAMAPLYGHPDATSAGLLKIPMGALVMGDASGDWVETPHGFLSAGDLEDPATVHADPVKLAQELVGTPYVWGGRTAEGIDCSGLVQLVCMMAGKHLPRDSDLQFAALSNVPDIAPDALQRGDLVFLPGHVGIMADTQSIIHASRHWMAVMVEPLADVVSRSAEKGHVLPVSGYKRLF